MYCRIFHQVYQNLLHQNAVHRSHHDLLRHARFYFDLRKLLLELPNRPAYDLFYDLPGRLKLRTVPVNSRDRKQVFHHPDQPPGFVANPF